MNSYLFFLGQNTALSRAEIEQLLPQARTTLINQSLLHLVSDQPLDLAAFGCRLGGSTKIAVKIADLSDQHIDQLARLIQEVGPKNFSLHLLHSPDSAKELSLEIKEKLGPRSRYLLSTGSLSPLVIRKQKVTELVIDFQTREIYHTQWLHDFKRWIFRDRRKPFITPKSGMLPPKLARIMVNLGVADRDPTQLTLLDPFCGTGTILMEAALMGLKVIGSDIAAEKIEGTRQNLYWLPAEHYCAPTQPPTLIQSDATRVSQALHQPVDVIITEPVLGPASFKEKDVKNLSTGLQKLYLGALKDWGKFLKKSSRVVIVLPVFKTQRGPVTTSNFIDSRENLGYNVVDKTLFFTRPGAKIERQIVILSKN